MIIEKTTREDRFKISMACYSIMVDIERANDILDELWDDFFSDADQKPIDKRDAERIGNRLYLARNVIYEALLGYYLTTGEAFCGAERELKNMEMTLTAHKADKAFDRAQEEAQSLPEEECKRRMVEINELRKLSDEEALKRLGEYADGK